MAIVLFTLSSANHTKTHEDIDLKFYDLVEDVLKEKYPNDDYTRTRTFEELKSKGIIEAIYDPELLKSRKKLLSKLDPYLYGSENDTKPVTETTIPPIIHKIIIKNETKKGFDICSVFTPQFFVGIVAGFVIGLPIGIGIVLYLKRGKTYNYAINKPLPLPQS